jgi:hypothetical protein
MVEPLQPRDLRFEKARTVLVRSKPTENMNRLVTAIVVAALSLNMQSIAGAQHVLTTIRYHGATLTMVSRLPLPDHRPYRVANRFR